MRSRFEQGQIKMNEYTTHLLSFHRHIKKNFAVLLLQIILIIIIDLIASSINSGVGVYVYGYLNAQLYFGITYTITKVLLNGRAEFSDFYEPFSDQYVWIIPAIYFGIVFISQRVLFVSFHVSILDVSYAYISGFLYTIECVMYIFLGFYVYFGVRKFREAFSGSSRIKRYTLSIPFVVAIYFFITVSKVGFYVSPTHKTDFYISLISGAAYYVFLVYLEYVVFLYSMAFIFFGNKIKNKSIFIGFS